MSMPIFPEQSIYLPEMEARQNAVVTQNAHPWVLTLQREVFGSWYARINSAVVWERIFEVWEGV